jgi:hypothetical protein
MIHLRFTPEASREVQELVDFLERLSRPDRRQVTAVGNAVRQGIGENFNRQRAGGGAPWARLAESTVLDRLRQGYGGRRPILTRSGSYRATLTNRLDARHSEQFTQRADGWSLAIGSDDRRDPWLQQGTRRMPGRPTTVLSPAAEERVLDTLDEIFMALEP